MIIRSAASRFISILSVVLIGFQVAAIARGDPATAPVTQPSAVDVDPKIRDAIVARIETLQNIEVTYLQREEYPPLTQDQIDLMEKGKAAATTSPNGAYIEFPTGIVENSCSFSFLHGAIRYEEAPIGDTLKQELEHEKTGDRVSILHSIVTLTLGPSGRIEMLKEGTNGPIGASIQSTGRVRHIGGNFMPAALGLMLDNLHPNTNGPWFTADQLQAYSFHTDGDDLVIMQPPNELPNTKRVWTFSKKLGFALIGFKTMDVKMNHVRAELSNTDFQLINGINVPMKVTETYYRPGGDDDSQPQSAKVTASVKQYLVNDPKNDAAHYFIAWPKAGTEVLDMRANKTVRTEKDGQVLDDATISRLPAIQYHFKPASTEPATMS